MQNEKPTLSVTTPETSDTFCEATSVNFQPTSATLPVILDAPNERADQLWKTSQWQFNLKRQKQFTQVVFFYRFEFYLFQRIIPFFYQLSQPKLFQEILYDALKNFLWCKAHLRVIN